MKSFVSNHESARLEVLRQYQILDTPPEEAFDELALLAAQICNTPIALINLIDTNRQWFKAKVGLNICEMPLNKGFGSICMKSGKVLIIPDTLADERFATNPLVTSAEFNVRFYAGAPLLAPGGEAIGTLCILDRVPHQISPQQVEALQTLSRVVIRQLEIRRNLAELESIKQDYKQAEEASHQSESSFFNGSPMMMGIADLVENDILHVSDVKQLEKQLLRTQRLESIGTLASGIAHDLNNVLSPILMSVHLLKAKSRDQQVNQMLSIIESNAKRGADLVKQVLSFARGIEGDIQGQGATHQHMVLQVKHLILEMRQIISQTFPKSIKVHTEIQEGLLPICADSTQLHQVLINLCLNARDAMLTDGTLTISAENIWIDETSASMHIGAKVGAYIVITVADTGFGIRKEILNKIFEPFFTTKELGKGTGLGLSTVMAIIKKYNGFITVSSCVGKGTKFQVYLPAVNQVPIQPLEDIEIQTGSGECILVVDDEAAIQEITKTSLEN